MSTSRTDDKLLNEAPAGRPETSLLYSSGSWRPPGNSLLPTPLNSLGLGGRPGSARPSWSKAGGGSGQPPKVAPLVMANAGRAIEEVGCAGCNAARVEVGWGVWAWERTLGVVGGLRAWPVQ